MDAIFLIEEGDSNLDDPKLVGAWQLLIDTGACWHMQGWYGRTAAYLIDQNICLQPPNPEETQDTETQTKTIKNNDPEYCDICECTPCDCGFGSY